MEEGGLSFKSRAIQGNLQGRCGHLPAQLGSSSSSNICKSLGPSGACVKVELGEFLEECDTDCSLVPKDVLDCRDWGLLGGQGFLMSASNVGPERRKGSSVPALQGPRGGPMDCVSP